MPYKKVSDAVKSEAVHQVGHEHETVPQVCKAMNVGPTALRRWVRAWQAEPALAASNLLNREFHPQARNQAWAGDITYVPTPNGWLYLAIVVDLYARRHLQLR